MPFGPSSDLVGIDRPFDEAPTGAFRWLPFPLLLASYLLTVVETVGADTPRPLLAVGVTALVLAGWTAGMLSTRRGPASAPWHYALYFVVRVGLTGVLVVSAPWFGIYAWFGYVEAIRYFTLPRVFLAVLLNSCVMSAGYLGGVPRGTSGWLFYLGVVAAGTLLVGFFAVAANRSRDRADERARTLEQLTEANARLERALTDNRSLQDQLVTRAREAGVLDERARLAGEIHDTLAQALAGIITQLDAAGRSGDGRHDDHLARARGLAGEGLAEARRSLHALRPRPLDRESGLPGALAETTARWSAACGVDAGFALVGSAAPLGPDAEIALLRAAQEGLANVARHAGAARVRLTLTYLADAVLLDVRDDGLGFRSAEVFPDAGHRLGLATMRERLGRVGGVLEVESEPGSGTALVARVPRR